MGILERAQTLFPIHSREIPVFPSRKSINFLFCLGAQEDPGATPGLNGECLGLEALKTQGSSEPPQRFLGSWPVPGIRPRSCVCM